jgi:hypothetical protein
MRVRVIKIYNYIIALFGSGSGAKLSVKVKTGKVVPMLN